jgi:hypothetical protein
MITDKLHDAMASLKGKSPDEIAAMMRERGIKGRAGTTQKCPLAVFFNGIQPGKFVVGRSFVMRLSGSHNTQPEKMATPHNLVNFLKAFDTGAYPELLAMPPRCDPKRKRVEKRTEDRHKARRTNVVRKHTFAKDVGRFMQ